MLQRVAWLRQLPERRATRLVFHDPDEFARLVDSRVRSGSAPSTSADHPAFHRAFGFSGRGGQTSASLANVQKSEVVAFFDEHSYTVHVRANAGQDTAAELSPAWVVAHEIGHSLQHQHFPIPDVARMSNEDQRLAALAMLEGDAMLVMLAYASFDLHAPLSRTVSRVQRAVAQDEANHYGSMSHSSEALSHASPLVRERLVFPYLAGAAFMGSMYRAGGYGLVNRVYSWPPSTTEQVLHPQKYLAGELAVVVREPALPHGFELAARGCMGELQTRSMLRQCNHPDLARRAAEGWGGDAFAIGRRGRAGLLFWSTTWDSEQDALEFEQAVRAMSACWRRDLGPAAGATSVLQKGLHVAVVRGLAPEPAGPALRSLTELPQPRQPSVPPFGAIALSPLLEVPARQPARLIGSDVVDAHLGLSFPVPPGFRAALNDDITLQSTSGTLTVSVSDWVVNTRTNERLFARFREGFVEALEVDRGDVSVVANTSVATRLGPALQRTWRVKSTQLFARLVIVPACQGTGALVLAMSWTDLATLTQLDWVLANLAQTGGRLPPLCGELNP